MLYKLILLTVLNGEVQVSASVTAMDEVTCLMQSAQYAKQYFVKCEPITVAEVAE